MSTTKVILIVGAACIVLFALLLWYTLKDKVDDVSKESPYRELINKPLTLQREMWLYKSPSALSKFTANFLAEAGAQQLEEIILLYKLPAGAQLSIHHFKSVKNGTSGYTSWYAIGKIRLDELKADVDFEYDWPRGYSFSERFYKEHGEAPWK